MLLLVRPLLILSAAMLLLVACTRERPTPEPTATTAVQSGAPATAVIEAEVVTDTTASGSGSNSESNSGTNSEASLAATNTPNPLTPQPEGGTPTPATPETFPYTVQAGDTLGSIATQFETDVETLRGLNNLDSDSLGVGQLIYVPYQEGLQGPGLPTPTPGPFYYTIQPGDTLSGLALRFGVDSITILEANATAVLDPNNLAVGTTILIPDYTPAGEETAGGTAGATPATDSGEPVVHIVTAGQGLLEIAALYGVSVAEITAANGMSDQDFLSVGQELIIPGITARDVAAAQGNVHVVQPGESLLSIALIYGVTVPELQAANELDNPDSIFIGQELIIPLP